MRLQWMKVDNAQHTFSVLREGHPPLSATLETRSYLVHDFAHYAVEKQAGLGDGFFGALARGATFDSLRDDAALPPEHDRWRAERLAALFQNVWKAEGSAAFAAASAWYCDAVEVDRVFVDGAVQRMRALMGQWRATRFGAVMEVSW